MKNLNLTLGELAFILKAMDSYQSCPIVNSIKNKIDAYFSNRVEPISVQVTDGITLSEKLSG